tara:strand:+ start:358 stop:624 length:267 start_codon:yes stop_codon:yes gene_type:complete
MGYRYTFVSDDVDFKFSKEFIDKHKDKIHFSGENKDNLPISSKHELKFIYSLIDDIKEEVENSDSKHGFFMFFIGEDGKEVLKFKFEK